MRIKQEEHTSHSFLDSMYRDYKNLMISIAHKYIGDMLACEDVVHNAFICLIRNNQKLQQLSPPKLRAYVLLAIRHASIDYLRKERNFNVADLSDDVLLSLLSRSREIQDSTTAPFKTVELFTLIHKLSIEDQTLLIGHYFIGLDTEELAQIIGCSPGTLRVKLYRAKKRAYDKFISAGLRFEDFISG